MEFLKSQTDFGVESDDLQEQCLRQYVNITNPVYPVTHELVVGVGLATCTPIIDQRLKMHIMTEKIVCSSNSQPDLIISHTGVVVALLQATFSLRSWSRARKHGCDAREAEKEY